jgi:hypothetical protein
MEEREMQIIKIGEETDVYIAIIFFSLTTFK